MCSKYQSENERLSLKSLNLNSFRHFFILLNSFLYFLLNFPMVFSFSYSCLRLGLFCCSTTAHIQINLTQVIVTRNASSYWLIDYLKSLSLPDLLDPLIN
jgi:hypothetical protein